MTRRFWIGVALGAPVFVLAMGDMVERRRACRTRSASRVVNWISFALATPVVFWCGWPFFERAWALARQPQPEHVHADRARRRRGVSATAWSRRSRPACFPPASACTAPSRPTSTRPSSSPCSCCSARCWSCARGTAPAPRSGSCSASRRRPRASCATAARRTCRSTEVQRRRRAARPARREGPGRRRRRRGHERRRRVDGHRRADPGARRAPGDRVIGGTINGDRHVC